MKPTAGNTEFEKLIIK